MTAVNKFGLIALLLGLSIWREDGAVYVFGLILLMFGAFVFMYEEE